MHLQHLGHPRVCTAQFELPSDECLIHLHPVVVVLAIAYLHCYLLIVLLISRLCCCSDDFFAVYVSLQCSQYLYGVDRLYQIVGNLRSDGLLHDVLLLALGDHHDGCGRRDFLYLLQRLQACESRHHLVEQDEVECLFAAFFYCVGTVGDGDNFVSFFL